MTNTGNLFLIPTAIAAGANDAAVSPHVKGQLSGIRNFLAEDVRTARRYLSSLKVYDSIEGLSFATLNKDTRAEELEDLFRCVFEGAHLGVLSESGCPGIADPGALAVSYAHGHGIRVIPLVGPSSILLALMASGLNGQRFAFHGYLPIQAKDTSRAIREYEKESRAKNQTQIFIETPYRNNALLANLARNLMPDTQLCIAVDITGPEEFILTKRVDKWRQQLPALPKNPAVFLFLA
ncbi:MAG TPA: SAM-dependent methyltransferase [Chryseosolibacter sp.]|nr:SAM-dependent methyltransferase [Chryseosolibacter sp.]